MASTAPFSSFPSSTLLHFMTSQAPKLEPVCRCLGRKLGSSACTIRLCFSF